MRTLLDDRAVVVKCRLSAVAGAVPRGALFAQLVDLLHFYAAFEIDDHTGASLSDDDVAAAHAGRLAALQRLAFKHVPALQELALTHTGALATRAQLQRHFAPLSAELLTRLATRMLRLCRPDDDACGDRAFVTEVLVSAFERRRSQRQAVAEMPLYPTEDVVWDEGSVPSASSAGDASLALPKLNLQFLTFHDYLLRNFNLFRLEATYAIRQDVGDVVARVAPALGPDGSTTLTGWARMAVPPLSVAVTEVRKPAVGESRPAGVTAEVVVELGGLRPDVRAEWDALAQHDVLFLLAVAPPDTDPAAHPARRAGVRYVRGCEVVEVRDADGRPVAGDAAFSRGRDAGPPRGTRRTLVVALDAAQYALDTARAGGVGAAGPGPGAAAAAGTLDVYASLNLVVRRKPEEGNFKAILECIRDLMGEQAAVPEWLHDLFLGYGDPGAAHWTALPQAQPTLDFKDTFLDAEHLRQCFPERDVTVVGADRPDVMPGAPAAPPLFRVTLKELLAPKRELEQPQPGVKRKAAPEAAGQPAEPPARLELTAEARARVGGSLYLPSLCPTPRLLPTPPARAHWLMTRKRTM